MEFSAIRTILAASSPAVWLGWLALLSFGVGLILLFRTRWRHANGILKCVVFSLYVHLILVMAAYGTRMWLGSSAGREDATISVRLLNDDELASILAESGDHSPPPPTPIAESVNSRPNPLRDDRQDDPTDDNPIDDDQGAETVRNESGDNNDDSQENDDNDGVAEAAVEISQTPETTDDPRVPVEPSDPLVDDTNPPESRYSATEDKTSPSEFVTVQENATSAHEPPTEVPSIDRPNELAVEPPSPLVVQPPRDSPEPQFSAAPDDIRMESPPEFDANRVVQSPTLTHSPTQSIRRPIVTQDRSLPPSGLQARPPSPRRVDLRTNARPVANRVQQPIARPARYGQRTQERQRQALLSILGRDDALLSVDEALQWLQSHQEPDGSWNPQRHGGGRETHTEGHDRRGAGINADMGMTGLALLAFVGAGHDHTQGIYRDTIGEAFAFLIAEQRENGDLSGDASLFAAMYCHGMAALALAELLAYSGDEQLRGPVERAVQFTIRSQDPRTGSWRYAPGDGQGDMSQFGWQVMVLTTAELSGISVPQTTQYRMTRFVDEMASGRSGGLSRYQRGHRPSRTMTAESLVCRQFLNIDVPTSAEREGFDFIGQERPGQGKANLYYWYYGSLAQMQYRSPGWQAWVKEMERTLVGSQQKTGPQAGSWSPDTKWGGYGGRVYSTALGALCLEVFYRYDRESNDADIPRWTRQDGHWGPLRR